MRQTKVLPILKYGCLNIHQKINAKSHVKMRGNAIIEVMRVNGDVWPPHYTLPFTYRY